MLPQTQFPDQKWIFADNKLAHEGQSYIQIHTKLRIFFPFVPPKYVMQPAPVR